jgi:hypothetical protein
VRDHTRKLFLAFRDPANQLFFNFAALLDEALERSRTFGVVEREWCERGRGFRHCSHGFLRAFGLRSAPDFGERGENGFRRSVGIQSARQHRIGPVGSVMRFQRSGCDSDLFRKRGHADGLDDFHRPVEGEQEPEHPRPDGHSLPDLGAEGARKHPRKPLPAMPVKVSGSWLTIPSAALCGTASVVLRGEIADRRFS